jgi:SAM-dependent methyltransferase
MLENKYDDPVFFERYGTMPRSREGLAAAGEWHVLRDMLPPLTGLRVLDLGCGYGWHCIHAAEQGAASVVGIDLSERMLEVACRKTAFPNVTYVRESIEGAAFSDGSFDLVMSSLAFHYVRDFRAVCEKVRAWLVPGGSFVFSVEHPVFTAHGVQDWHRDDSGNPAHWPVDRYFDESERRAIFLGEAVVKYHRTLAAYLGDLLENGFAVTGVAEPRPDPRLLDAVPGMRDELRRPMMLIISAKKRGAAV